MRIIKRNIVSALIFSKDGRLFLGKKHESKGGVYAGYWHFPGGGIENNEEPVAALVREVLEETGIDIKNYQITLVDDQGIGESQKTLASGEGVLCKMNFAIYRIDIGDKKSQEIDVQLNDDLDSFQWVELSELRQIKLTPPSVSLFKRIGML